MQNIWDVYLTIKQLIADKTRNSVPTPESISYALDLGQQAARDYYKQLKEQGDDLANTALAPFLKTIPLTSSSSGLLTYPDDWFDTELITEVVDGEFVTYNTVLDNELFEAKRSVLYPIAQNPRYMELSNGVQLYPETTHLVGYKYMTIPATPVIGYTVSGNTQVYNPATSVQLTFKPAYYGRIILHSLPYIGVNLSDAEITQLSGLLNLTK